MKVIFGTICKNIEGQFQAFKLFVQDLYEKLPEAHLCIYENNSTDATKDLLKMLSGISTNIHIQSENIDKSTLLEIGKARTWDNLPCRMECIAFARNKLLDMINAVGYDDEDRIVMFDADVDRPLNIDRIKERLAESADAIFANGVKRNSMIYYDMYALRSSSTTPLGPEIIGDAFWKSMHSIQITTKTPVFSTFGGLCIYRGACIRDNSYSAIPTKELHELNKRIVKLQNITLPQIQTHIAGALQGVYLHDRDMFYVNNSGYNFPVVCEHSTFHATMYMRGQTKLYIDPDLIYYSTH